MATGFELRAGERASVVPQVRARRDRLSLTLAGIEGVEPTGHPVERLPHIASVIVRGADGGSITVALDLEDVAASTGSACTSGSTEVSHVLSAMGYPPEEARGALRLSLGRTTTDADVDAAAAIVPGVIERLRAAELSTEPIGVG
jgi:cysteine desulfurase